MEIFALILSFIFMECVAWFTHKYIMHGFLWNLHKDHHQPNTTGGAEKNDFFFLIFATPAIICFFLGYKNFSIPFWVGLGITMYGLAYFFVHDLFIHQRYSIFKKTGLPYFKAIRKAHKIHHKNQSKHHASFFGMLWVPVTFYKNQLKNGK